MKKPEFTIISTKMKVIYIRFKGTYDEYGKASKEMFQELFMFACRHNLMVEGETKFLTMYHDNPFITNEKNLRTSIAMTIPHDADVIEEGRICTMEFSGKYAVLHYELTLAEYGEAWKYAYQEWTPENIKEKPRDDFPFELYVTEIPRNFEDTSLTDIYIPIE